MMGGNLLLAYLLIKRQFSILILSGSFPIFDLKKRGAEWALHSLRLISPNAFFWSIKSWLIVLTFCPHILHAWWICDSSPYWVTFWSRDIDKSLHLQLLRAHKGNIHPCKCWSCHELVSIFFCDSKISKFCKKNKWAQGSWPACRLLCLHMKQAN